MNYIEVMFWIESAYDKMNGWADQKSEADYFQELRHLLESVGWNVARQEEHSNYPVATKGQEYLELRPTCLHGILKQESTKRIAKLLSMAKFFLYKQIEVLSRAEDMPSWKYLMKLKAEQDSMVEDIRELCETASEERIITAEDIYQDIEKKYHVQRIGEFGEDVILRGVFENLLSVLVSKGEVTQEMTEAGKAIYRRIKASPECAA